MDSLKNSSSNLQISQAEKATLRDCKRRTIFNEYQLNSMNHMFYKNPYITSVNAKSLACRLGLAEKNVKIWFQNKRARQKIIEKSSALKWNTESSSIHIYNKQYEAQRACYDDRIALYWTYPPRPSENQIMHRVNNTLLYENEL